MGALAAAFAGHPNPHATGRNQVAVGTGFYKQSAAVAMGYFRIVNENVMLNAGVSTNLAGGGETAVKAGITFAW